METYILTHGKQETRIANLREFNEMRLIAECHSKAFRYAQNYGLSALYWISRDLYKEQSQSAHPHAKRLSDIRNALEHRYVKVCWPFATELSEKRRDSSAFYISEDELRIQSMELRSGDKNNQKSASVLDQERNQRHSTPFL